MPKEPKLASALERVLALRSGSPNWFIPHMDQHFEQAEEPRMDAGWFHPSALSSPCDALLAFDFLGMPQQRNVSARLRRIFDNGHSTEGRWQLALQQAGLATLKTKEERKFEIPQYRIRGECDNIIRHPVTGEKYIFEFKTKNHDLFTAMTAPDASWVPQVHCYMFGFGVLQTMVVVEDKNTQDVKSYLVPFDMAVWRGITERVTRILERLGQRQEIARTPVARDSECAYYPPSPDGKFAGCAGFNFGEA